MICVDWCLAKVECLVGRHRSNYRSEWAVHIQILPTQIKSFVQIEWCKRNRIVFFHVPLSLCSVDTFSHGDQDLVEPCDVGWLRMIEGFRLCQELASGEHPSHNPAAYRPPRNIPTAFENRHIHDEGTECIIWAEE